MPDNHASAAQCWAVIEQLLVSTALPDERIDAVRAECIRIIGEAIGGVVPAPVVPKRSRRRGGQRARGVTPPDKAKLGSGMAAKPGKTTDKLPLPFPVAERLPARQAMRSAPVEAYLSKTLAIMLERSCGYSGDDEVSYGPRT